MLTNKKFGVRLFAIVLALLMTAAIFAGCQDKTAIDEAKDAAAAASKAAADAQALAESARAAAEELKTQLAKADAEIEAQKKALEEQEQKLKEQESKIDDIGKDPGTTPGDLPGEITELVTGQILSDITALKIKYLTTRANMYTSSNFTALSILFERAYTELYRATTKDGVKNIVSKLAADAAVVPNIESDSKTIKDQIAAFGPDASEVFTANKDKVAKARLDYINWLKNYEPYFAAKGNSIDKYINNDAATVNSVNAFVINTFGINVKNLVSAEVRLATLNTKAAEAAELAYLAIQTVWGETRFDKIKANHEAIREAYNRYVLFVNANGGDDTPIKHTDTVEKRTLTGEEFVKLYVNVLNDNWFAQYLTEAKSLLDALPGFFMNNGAPSDPRLAGLNSKYLGYYPSSALTKTAYGKTTLDTDVEIKQSKTSDEQILKQFQNISVQHLASILNLTYTGDFKANGSNLADAFLTVDNAISKAVAEMAGIFLNKVIVPDVEKELVIYASDSFVNNITNKYSEAKTEETGVYKTADMNFYQSMSVLYTANINKMRAYTAKTYEQLSTVSGSTLSISNLYIFKYDFNDAGDIVVTYNNNERTNPIEIILNSLNADVQSIEKTYKDDAADILDAAVFHDFVKDLAKQLTLYSSHIGNTTNEYLTGIGSVGTALSGTNLTAFQNSIKALADAGIDEMLALKYDNYASKTYQATNSSGTKLYYSNAALGTTQIKTSSASSAKALNITVDKIIVAKDAASQLYATHADKMLTKALDNSRAAVETKVTKAVNDFKAVYLSGSVDSLNFNTDVDKYVDNMKKITEMNTLTAFKLSAFSKNGATNYTANTKLQDVFTAANGYAIEELTAANTYMIHVIGYADVNTIAVTNYTNKATTEVNKFFNLAIASSADSAQNNLMKVRSLAYKKDDAIIDLGKLLTEFKGTWDDTNKVWKGDVTGNGLPYEYNNTTMRYIDYIAELDKVYARLADKINAVSMLDSDVNGSLTAAQTKLNSFLGATWALSTPATTSANAKKYDDYSFIVAYLRYYESDPAQAYSWTLYNS